MRSAIITGSVKDALSSITQSSIMTDATGVERMTVMPQEINTETDGKDMDTAPSIIPKRMPSSSPRSILKIDNRTVIQNFVVKIKAENALKVSIAPGNMNFISSKYAKSSQSKSHIKADTAVVIIRLRLLTVYGYLDVVLLENVRDDGSCGGCLFAEINGFVNEGIDACDIDFILCHNIE